jgi:hypothetical protein
VRELAAIAANSFEVLSAGGPAQAGLDATLKGRNLQDALRSAIATRRGTCSWTVETVEGSRTRSHTASALW